MAGCITLAPQLITLHRTLDKEIVIYMTFDPPVLLRLYDVLRTPTSYLYLYLSVLYI